MLNSIATDVEQDVHDSRDDEIANLKLQIKLLIAKNSNQPSVSSQQNSGNDFVSSNTNSYQQFVSTQTLQQQTIVQTPGKYSIYNDDDAFCSFFIFKQQQNTQAQLQLENFLLMRRLNR